MFVEKFMISNPDLGCNNQNFTFLALEHSSLGRSESQKKPSSGMINCLAKALEGIVPHATISHQPTAGYVILRIYRQSPIFFIAN